MPAGRWRHGWAATRGPIAARSRPSSSSRRWRSTRCRTIGWAVAEPLAIHRLGRAPIVRTHVVELLGKVGLGRELVDRRPSELSGGQLQRVNIARALALAPRLLVCDEAVSSLDVSVQAQILNLLLDIHERDGLSMLFISHDLAVVRHIADRVVVLLDGRVVEAGPVEDVVDRPREAYTQRLVAAAEARE